MIPPGADEIEVSLFGPGVGECVVVHIGQGNWLVIDSCTEPGTSEPVALEYLRTIGADLQTQVRLFLVSHWHDDHIRGAAKLLREIQNPLFAASAACSQREFLQLVTSLSVTMLATDRAQAESSASPREVYAMVFGPSSISIPDNGAGTAAAYTLVFQYGSVFLNCLDAHGCNVTFSELGAVQQTGRFMHIVNISANAINFADTAGLSELAGAFAAGQWDVLSVFYVSDRFVEISRSNN